MIYRFSGIQDFYENYFFSSDPKIKEDMRSKWIYSFPDVWYLITKFCKIYFEVENSVVREMGIKFGGESFTFKSFEVTSIELDEESLYLCLGERGIIKMILFEGYKDKDED